MPARGAHVRDAARRRLGQPPRYLDPDAFHGTLGRHADHAHENTQDVPRTHRDAAGQPIDRQVGIRMLLDRGLEVSVPLRRRDCRAAAHRPG
jgi:hypothetical protein